MKFKSLSVLLAVFLLRPCAASGEQFIESGSGGHPGITDAEAARTIKISVTQHGSMIKVNSAKTTLEGLERALQEVATQRGEICYYKDWPKIKPSQEEPLTTAILVYVDLKLDPVSTKVLKVAADYHLPVFFSKNTECSEGVVREVQNFRDVILSSPVPNRPLSEKKNGGAGVFRQHINRESGDVTSVTIKQSTRHASLDRCAVDALREWKYTAPTKFETLAIPITFVAEGATIEK